MSPTANEPGPARDALRRDPARRPAAAADAHAIFINYRREDSGGQARALLYALEASFPGQVFMDVKTLVPGANYVEEIERTVAGCRAVLVLIGKSWATITDASGRRRLDDPRDVVVLEVAAALRRQDVLVIPVLVAGAALPAEGELPESLRGLLDRHCLHLTDQDWEYDIGKLVTTLRHALGPAESGGTRRRRELAVGAAVVAAVVVLAAIVGLVRSSGSRAPTERARVTEPAGTAPTADAARTAPSPSPVPVPAAPAAGATMKPVAQTTAPAATVPAPPPAKAAAPPPQKVALPASPAPPAPARSVPPATAEIRRAAPAAAPPAPVAQHAAPNLTAAEKRAPALAVASPSRPEPEPPRAPAASEAKITGSPPPEAAQAYVTAEIVGFAQVYGDPRLEDRGRKLFDGARWKVEPGGALTFEPRDQAAGFFPLTVPGSRDAQHVSFEGSRVAKASDGHGYVRISGRITPGPAKADAAVEIEFGRSSGDGTDRDPTYRARARLRLSPR